nr:uncharacterized protein LOC115267239 [Aedes albopictus]
MYCRNCHSLVSRYEPISWRRMLTSPFVFTFGFSKRSYGSSEVILNSSDLCQSLCKMPVCAVNICRISSTDAENRSEVVSFHCFPKEKTRRARWLKFCGLHNDTGKSLYICSQHFPRESFANNATIQKMLNPQGGARNLLIKNVDPSIRKPSAPEEECTARAARQYRKQRKAVVAALLEAHENGAIEERHLLETHNRGEIGEKPLCDFECSIQQPFAVQPTSFQTEANFVDPNRTLLPMPQQLLSHNERISLAMARRCFQCRRSHTLGLKWIVARTWMSCSRQSKSIKPSTLGHLLPIIRRLILAGH